MRTLAYVGLVHHDRVVQQLLVDARSEIGGLDVVRPHFLSFAIVDGELGHFGCQLSAVSYRLELWLTAESQKPIALVLLFLLVLDFTLWFHRVRFADDDIAAVRAGYCAANQQRS